MTVPRSRWATHHYPDPNELPGPGGEGLPYALVLRPGDPLGNHENVFTTWAALYAVLSTIPGPKLVQVDDTLAPAHMTTGGPYNLDGVTFIGVNDSARGGTILTIDQGATIAPGVITVRSGLNLSNASTAVVQAITGVENAIWYVEENSELSSTAGAAPLISSVVPSGVHIFLDNSTLGDGTHTVVETTGAPLHGVVIDDLNNSAVNNNSLSAAAVDGIQVFFDDSSTVPTPATANVDVSYVTPGNSRELIDPGQAAAAAIVIPGSPITQSKSGVVKVTGIASLVASGAGTLTAQLFRDAVAFGPTVTKTAAAAGTFDIEVTWDDQLPVGMTPHTYSLHCAISAGTISTVANTGGVVATEQA